MTRRNILASVLYRTAVDLKNQKSSKLIWKHSRNKFISSLSSMQFLTGCIGLKNISDTDAQTIISVLRISYNYNTDEFSNGLMSASSESDNSSEYEEILFYMYYILSECINCITKKEKNYINTASRYIKAFHNLPRVFLSITDKAKISPSDAIKYSKSYLKLD